MIYLGYTPIAIVLTLDIRKLLRPVNILWIYRYISFRLRRLTRDTVRSNAVRLTLTVVCGSYQSSLLSYFMYNDLFTSLVTYISSTSSSSEILRASVLLALLSTYNKQESSNPYQSRLRDFINEDVMSKIIECVGTASKASREAYTTIQDDAVDGLLGGVSKVIGGYVPFGLASRLGLGGTKTPTSPSEDIDDALAKLYIPALSVLTVDRTPRLRFY